VPTQIAQERCPKARANSDSFWMKPQQQFTDLSRRAVDGLQSGQTAPDAGYEKPEDLVGKDGYSISPPTPATGPLRGGGEDCAISASLKKAKDIIPTKQFFGAPMAPPASPLNTGRIQPQEEKMVGAVVTFLDSTGAKRAQKPAHGTKEADDSGSAQR